MCLCCAVTRDHHPDRWRSEFQMPRAHRKAALERKEFWEQRRRAAARGEGRYSVEQVDHDRKLEESAAAEHAMR